MPGPYGTADNPVVLDPFRRIVEVHWASPWIAAQLDVGLDTTPDGETTTGPGPDFVEPFSFASMVAAAYSFGDNPLKAFRIFESGAWRTAPGDEMEVSGDPVLPGPYAYALWTWQGIDGAGLKAPYYDFKVGGEGAALDLPVPDHPDQRFTDGFSGSIVLRAQGFVGGGPYASPFSGTVNKWKTADATGAGPYTPVIQDAETASISADGMSLVFRGKTYLAVGSKVIAVTVEGFDRGEFWVLFKKEVAP